MRLWRALGWPCALLLAGCAALVLPTQRQHQLEVLLPTDALLVGEQHDIPEHQALERAIVAQLAARGQLAALALEMAERGSSTAALTPQADAAAVQQALHWQQSGWSWSAYGPAIMQAVRAGVPVLGANLPRTALADAQQDSSLDALLDSAALATQQEAIRVGHCGQLPEPRVQPMVRVQIARDRAMAQTVAEARRPGQTVLLLSGAGHTDPALGVVRHLPPALQYRTLLLRAADAVAGDTGRFSLVWTTAPAPPTDYCAAWRKPAAGKERP